MKKTFWIFGIIVAALIIIASIIIGLYLGPIVKIGVEQVGPKVAQVSIKVEAVDISLLTGSAKVKGLVVGNPSGYKGPQAISVGTISVSMDPFSVVSKKIVIHSIQVQSPEITLEGGLGSNNLTKILDNVNGPPQSSAPAPANAGTQAANKPAATIEVDDFLITGAKVLVALPGLGRKSISLPDIHLTDLGKGSSGLTPVELTSYILKAIITDTVKAVASSVQDISQGVQNLGKGAVSTVGTGVSGIANSIGGLLGK